MSLLDWMVNTPLLEGIYRATRKTSQTVSGFTSGATFQDPANRPWLIAGGIAAAALGVVAVAVLTGKGESALDKERRLAGEEADTQKLIRGGYREGETAGWNTRAGREVALTIEGLKTKLARIVAERQTVRALALEQAATADEHELLAAIRIAQGTGGDKWKGTPPDLLMIEVLEGRLEALRGGKSVSVMSPEERAHRRRELEWTPEFKAQLKALREGPDAPYAERIDLSPTASFVEHLTAVQRMKEAAAAEDREFEAARFALRKKLYDAIERGDSGTASAVQQQAAAIEAARVAVLKTRESEAAQTAVRIRNAAIEAAKKVHAEKVELALRLGRKLPPEPVFPTLGLTVEQAQAELQRLADEKASLEALHAAAQEQEREFARKKLGELSPAEHQRQIAVQAGAARAAAQAAADAAEDMRKAKNIAKVLRNVKRAARGAHVGHEGAHAAAVEKARLMRQEVADREAAERLRRAGFGGGPGAPPVGAQIIRVRRRGE